MKIRRIEALALVIAKYSGGFNPEDKAFQLCNPGRLRVFSNRTFPGEWNEGLRAFKSWTDGLRALIFDLETKCAGKSRTHMGPETTLKDLLGAWGMREPESAHLDGLIYWGIPPRKAVTFLRRALEDETIEKWTPIGWFMADRVTEPSTRRAI